MALRITVALGTTKYYYGRLTKLLNVAKQLDEDIAIEHPVQDKKRRWSYTFTTTERNRSRWWSHLKDNGRFKIISIEDLEDGQTTIINETKSGR